MPKGRLVIFSFIALLFFAALILPKLSLRNESSVLSNSVRQNTLLRRSTLKINQRTIAVEIADTDTTRSLGLSGRISLRPDEGMLFIWEKEVYPIFWMKDMNFPLDVIWLNRNKVVAISENMQPEPDRLDRELTLYPAPAAINMVLEVNAGFAQKNNIKVGNSVTLD